MCIYVYMYTCIYVYMCIHMYIQWQMRRGSRCRFPAGFFADACEIHVQVSKETSFLAQETYFMAKET